MSQEKKAVGGISDDGGGCVVINKPELWNEVSNRIRNMSPEDRELAFEMFKLASTAEDQDEAEEARRTFIEVLAENEVKELRARIVDLPLSESANAKVPHRLDKWRRHVAKQIQSMRNKLGLTQQQNCVCAWLIP